MGGTKCFEDKTAPLGQQLEFVKQPRLANARLTHHANHLPLSVSRLFAGLFEMLDLLLPPDKTRQATCG